jgi:hypothetical protein
VRGKHAITVAQGWIDDVSVFDGPIEVSEEAEGLDSLGVRGLFVHGDAMLSSGLERQGGQHLLMAGEAALLDVPVLLALLNHSDGA